MQGYIWYLNDILICSSNTKTEHQAIVEKVLQQCVQHRFTVNLVKSEFHVCKTIFLEYVINGQEVKMDLSELGIMFQWPIPAKKKEVQRLLGFAYYYCRFIINCSTKVHHLIDLTKDLPFTWGHTV